MEQIRIIKEMRDEARQLCLRGAIEHIRPRYMVWENVPGAFSSNKGEDFRCVLEETARIVCEDAVIPRPENGKWTPSGCIMGDGWSIAWRVHDAQFWGVPQRRKRIALVADFGGDTAPEILFERESVSGNTEESSEERQEVTGTVGENFDKAISFQERARKPGGAKESSYNMSEQEPCQHSTISQCWDGTQTSPTLTANNAGGSQRMPDKENFNAVITFTPDSEVKNAIDEIAFSMLSRDYKDPQCVCYGVDCYNQTQSEEVSKSLNSAATDSDHIPCVYGLDRASFNQGQNALYDFSVEEELAQPIVARGPGGGTEQSVGALCARDYKGVGNQYVDEGKLIVQDRTDFA